MGRISTFYGRVLDACGLAAALILLAMTALIVADVALRNLAGIVIRGSVELTEYGLYLAATLAAPWLLRQGRHIRIDVAVARMPPAAGWAAELFCDILGLALTVTLAGYAVATTLKSARSATLIVKDFIIPEWWALWPLALMFVLLAIEFVFRLHRLTTGPRRPRREGGSA